VSGEQRRKGREGELESRKIFERAGLTVVPLQAGRSDRRDSGDYIVKLNHPEIHELVCDSKRREKIRNREWSRGIEAIVRDGQVGASLWRPSCDPWRVTLLAEDFVRIVEALEAALREAKQ
jgi:hypothetical protein